MREVDSPEFRPYIQTLSMSNYLAVHDCDSATGVISECFHESQPGLWLYRGCCLRMVPWTAAIAG